MRSIRRARSVHRTSTTEGIRQAESSLRLGLNGMRADSAEEWRYSGLDSPATAPASGTSSGSCHQPPECDAHHERRPGGRQPMLLNEVFDATRMFGQPPAQYPQPLFELTPCAEGAPGLDLVMLGAFEISLAFCEVRHDSGPGKGPFDG